MGKSGWRLFVNLRSAGQVGQNPASINATAKPTYFLLQILVPMESKGTIRNAL